MNALDEAREIIVNLIDNTPMPFRCGFCYEMSTDTENHEPHCPFTKARLWIGKWGERKVRAPEGHQGQDSNENDKESQQLTR